MNAVTSLYLKIHLLLLQRPPAVPFSWDYSTRQDSSAALFLYACKTPSVLHLSPFWWNPESLRPAAPCFSTNTLIHSEGVNLGPPSRALFFMQNILTGTEQQRPADAQETADRERARGEMRSRWIYIPLWQLIWQHRKIWKWILILCSSSSCDLCPCSLRWSSSLVCWFWQIVSHWPANKNTRLKPPCISIFICGIWHQ